LIPDHASWSIRFATNEMVIAYTGKSRYSDEIDSSNWTDILLRADVIYGRSDPDKDPCGYRAVMSLMLAESFYNIPGLARRFIAKDRDYIRPKEVDLIALMESNAIDYMFQYRSVAIQHKLSFIELPDEINLGNPALGDLYGTITLDIDGSRPGEKMKVTGEYINYSLTIPRNAPSAEAAEGFVSFLLSSEGMEIFRQSGQEPILPFSTDQPGLIPDNFKIYLR
jgi:molybdate/tungstate transport system substrate-binding protein